MRARSRALGILLLALLGSACATAPPRLPVSPEAAAIRARLEERWQAFRDLRAQAEIRIRRRDRSQRLSGVLLLRAPASLRFEALSPFGPPLLLVASDAEQVTVWEVLKSRAYLLPASAGATQRWLGLALGSDDLVALLSGHVRPLREARAVELLPPDETGPSLSLSGADVTQRIWFDPATGQTRQVELTGGKNPMRIVYSGGGALEPIVGLGLATLDGGLQVDVRYRNPQVNTGFDSDLLRLSVPQHVEIQDFR
jgi:outer membrane lipoprotein-sorting protein